MPNSKQREVKIKHRKNRRRQKGLAPVKPHTDNSSDQTKKRLRK